MILYTLACDAGHRFDSWFRDSAAFDDQAGRHLVCCPVCHSTNVAKTIMAPAVVGGQLVAEASRTAQVAAQGAPQVALLDGPGQALRAAVKAFRDRLMAEGKDVGRRFPDEARRMHEGDIPYQPIHGQASPEEARGLIEDGVMIMPLPSLPEELN